MSKKAWKPKKAYLYYSYCRGKFSPEVYFDDKYNSKSQSAWMNPPPIFITELDVSDTTLFDVDYTPRFHAIEQKYPPPADKPVS